MIGVLFVCTGNICRSPTAEGVFRHKVLEAGLNDRVSTDSAGTHSYHIGDPPAPMAITCGQDRGYDFADLRARQLKTADFNDFALILGMDQGHMSLIERARPTEATATSHLLLDFASGPEAEVPDPWYGTGRKEYEHSLDLIESAMPGLLEALRRNYL